MGANFFSLIKATTNSCFLFESTQPVAISKPTQLFFNGKKVAIIKSTIGRVNEPIYIGTIDSKIDAKTLVDKKLTTQK